jgi:hypothetical protein
MLLMARWHQNVSLGYIFIFPLVFGAIPVLFSTKEQLRSYWTYLIMPWGITGLLFFICLAFNIEGMICLIIIVGPFLIMGTLGALGARLYRLKTEGPKTPLYSILLMPFLVLVLESIAPATDQFHTVTTSIDIGANRSTVWANVKNVRNIQSSEIGTHFIHVIGIPKPLNGELDREGVGAISSISWEKGIKFLETIKSWKDGNGFAYDINVDPSSIPPTTLDEHVIIGGRYFDVVEGGYSIDSISSKQSKVTLTCKYRVTTNLNFYSKWWADLILEDFNEMILEVIKKRSELLIKGTEH